MTGYTPDEKLRLQQLRELRRRWLKDQELSPREPVLPPKRMWPMEAFWNKFLQDRAPWKNMIYKVYRNSIFAVTHILIPTWIVHYYVKYHVSAKPYAIVARKPRIFPLWYQTAKPVFCGLTSITAALNDVKALIFCTTVGDTILETGEVIPPMKEFPDQHH